MFGRTSFEQHTEYFHFRFKIQFDLLVVVARARR